MRRALLRGIEIPISSFLLAGACLLAAGLVFSAPSVQAQRLPLSTSTGGTLSPTPSRPFTLHDVVRTTLDEGTAIRTGEEQLHAAQGRLRAATGAFDVELNASVSSGIENTLFEKAQRQQLDDSKINRERSSYEVGLSKQFRSGLLVRSSVSTSRTDAISHAGAPTLRKGANLSLRYPLMRGRSQTVAAAEADAARRSQQASRLSLKNTAARSLRDAANAYWDYRAAHRQLRVLRGSEKRARVLLTETKALVEAEERPASTLNQLRANVADAVAQRTEAEQALREARRRVGLAMGIPPEQIRSLPVPTDSFPKVADTLNLPAQKRVVERALEGRADLRSASAREKAAQSRLEAQRSAVKPRLDLQIGLEYAALSDERGMSVFQHAPPFGQSTVGGPTGSIQLTYSLPVGNHTARGRLAEQKAIYLQRQITSNDLVRRAKSGAAVALDELRSSRTSVKKAREAVSYYRAAVEDERKKLRQGMSTLLDVTTLEDRLTSALSTLIASQTRYAKALVRLRYEAGTLLLPGSRKKIVGRARAQAERLRKPLSAN